MRSAENDASRCNPRRSPADPRCSSWPSGPCHGLPGPGPGAGPRLTCREANRPDVLKRLGRYPPPPGAPADIRGYRIAGTGGRRRAKGRRHSSWARTVYALVAEGSYAGYCLAGAGALPATVLEGFRRRKPRPCPKRCSPSGTMCSSAARRKPARPCWCTAAPAGSARWRSSSASCSA